MYAGTWTGDDPSVGATASPETIIVLDADDYVFDITSMEEEAIVQNACTMYADTPCDNGYFDD